MSSPSPQTTPGPELLLWGMVVLLSTLGPEEELAGPEEDEELAGPLEPVVAVLLPVPVEPQGAAEHIGPLEPLSAGNEGFSSKQLVVSSMPSPSHTLSLEILTPRSLTMAGG